MNTEFKTRSAGRTDFSVWKPEIAAAMQERGFESLADLTEALGALLQDPTVAKYCPSLEAGNIHAHDIAHYIHKKGGSGYSSLGNISPVAELISIVLEKDYDELYPEIESAPHRAEIININDCQDEPVEGSDVAAARSSLKGTMASALMSLTPREERIVRSTVYEGMTLRDTGEEFNVGAERIRSIQAKAFRKLRHPSKGLKACFDVDPAESKPQELPERHAPSLEDRDRPFSFGFGSRRRPFGYASGQNSIPWYDPHKSIDFS